MRKVPIVYAALVFGWLSAPVLAEETKTVWTESLTKAAQAAFLIQRGDLLEGVELSHEALARDLPLRDRAAALTNLCMAEVALRRAHDAIKNCTGAAELNANLWQAYNNRANAYVLLGDYDAAISDYQRALELRPEHTVVERNLTLAIDRKSRGVPPTVDERES